MRCADCDSLAQNAGTARGKHIMLSCLSRKTEGGKYEKSVNLKGNLNILLD